MNNSISKKNGVEFLSLFFKDQPLCILYTNLKNNENKQLLSDIFKIVRTNMNSDTKDIFNLVVFDSEKVRITNIK